MRPPAAVALAWTVCASVVAACATGVAVRARYPDAFPPDDQWLPTAVVAVGVAAMPVVGAVLVTRVRGNRYGWTWCALGAGIGLLLVAYPMGEAGLLPSWAEVVASALVVLLTFPALVHVLLRFPDGRVPAPAWRWLARLTDGVAVLSCLAALLAGPDRGTPGVLDPDGRAAASAGTVLTAGVLTLSVCVVAAAVSVADRHRRAGRVERLQLRWFTAAAVGVGVLVVLEGLGVDPLPGTDRSGVVSAVVTAVSFLLLSGAVAVAVLRYRLYEIDRIVSRTVSYAVVTGGLLVLYLVAVATLRPLLTPLTGTSDLAVVVSTLAAAAAFRPVRRRVQDRVDRRFDRARYDAARAVDAYARRLRTSVDLDTVTAGLRDTVTVTVGPDRVLLWVRGDAAADGGR